MEELIPFVFFILWFLFGGLGSKKKREEAQRQAEAQREAAEAARRARAEQRRAARESRDTEGRRSSRNAERYEEAPTTTMSTSSGDSLDMIPDELWNILTGGAPRPTPQQQPEAERDATPPGGWVTSPPWDEEDATNSIEGVSHEDDVTEVVDYDDEAISRPRGREVELRDAPWDQKPTSRDALALRRDETSELRHVEFHDKLMEGEIGARAAAASRASVNTRLGLGGIADVRRAIILAEILGPPKSMR